MASDNDVVHGKATKKFWFSVHKRSEAKLSNRCELRDVVGLERLVLQSLYQASYLKLSANPGSEESSPPVLSTRDRVARNCSCDTATAPKIADGARGAFWLAVAACLHQCLRSPFTLYVDSTLHENNQLGCEARAGGGLYSALVCSQSAGHITAHTPASSLHNL